MDDNFSSRVKDISYSKEEALRLGTIKLVQAPSGYVKRWWRKGYFHTKFN